MGKTPPKLGQAKSDLELWASGVTWIDSDYDERTGEALRPEPIKLEPVKIEPVKIEIKIEDSRPLRGGENRGRPREKDWEGCIIFAAAHCYWEGLPENQAGLETVMRNWFTDQNKKAAESEVRKRAKALMEAFTKADN